MPNLSRARQRSRIQFEEKNQAKAQENLTRAFLTFTQAAGSVERSYTQLQAEVTRLHRELQKTNSELERSLEENARMRTYLARVLENLPCGVLVLSQDGRAQVVNPEARRLLQIPAEWSAIGTQGISPHLEKLIAEAPANSFYSEQEWVTTGTNGNRYIGILRANVSEISDGPRDSIWIVRDITEEKKAASEREAARRSHALAEIAT